MLQVCILCHYSPLDLVGLVAEQAGYALSALLARHIISVEASETHTVDTSCPWLYPYIKYSLSRI
jgi:hypothetical protein